MALRKEKKQEVISKYRCGEKDCGSSEVQIALLTQKINSLVDHLRSHAKDNHGRFGLINLISKRKRLLAYLSRTSFARYQALIKSLGIRQ